MTIGSGNKYGGGSHDMTMHQSPSTNPPMAYYKITRLATGGFVVKDGLHDTVFASTRIDEALLYVRDKLAPDPLVTELVTDRLRGAA